jgi:hypothetical protein
MATATAMATASFNSSSSSNSSGTGSLTHLAVAGYRSQQLPTLLLGGSSTPPPLAQRVSAQRSPELSPTLASRAGEEQAKTTLRQESMRS